MKKYIVSNLRTTLLSTALLVTMLSCNKDLVVDAAYPEQTVYLAQAAIAVNGPGANGIYTVTPSIAGRTFRFTADPSAGRVNVQLAVLRSGIDLDGTFTVGISTNSDTIATLIGSNLLPAGAEPLPSSAYTIPSTVTVQDGSNTGEFDLSINYDFLNTNRTRKFAVAVAISEGGSKQLSSRLGTAVIYIDPAQILVPVANFISYQFNDIKTVNFTNTSSNGVSYNWDFGDGTPASTEMSPSHVYASSGTYLVTLTTVGVAGSSETSVKTANIVIP